MKKVIVIGSGGSGKTTFARRLAERTGPPLIHLDREYWHPGWIPTPADEWQRKVAELVRGDAWIIDGNYGGTLDLRLKACDTVVFLDLPRLTCLWRAIKRVLIHRGRERPEMPPGCPERVSWDFVKWIWSYPTTRRPAILRRLAELAAAKQVVILRSASEIEEFISATRKDQRPGRT